MDMKKGFKAADPNETGRLDVMQFAELIKLGAKTASKMEMDTLFRVVDKQGKGYLTEQDLTYALANIGSVLNQEMVVLPKDLLMPLLYKLKNVIVINADGVFTKFRNETKNKFDMGSFS